jgi:hypothetical protein
MTHKRNPLLAIIALPIAILLWTIGWCLYRTGSHHRSLKAKTKYNKESVSIFTAFPVEQEMPERQP